jgi:hypothetical protein
MMTRRKRKRRRKSSLDLRKELLPKMSPQRT